MRRLEHQVFERFDAMFVVDPAPALLLILLIGIAVGVLMYRYAG